LAGRAPLNLLDCTESGERAAARSIVLASFLTIVALIAATAFTFDTLLSPREIPCYRDLLFFTVPFKRFLADHLRRGEIPFWNPDILLGTPFLANLQSGVFYPLSVLLLLPFPIGFNIFLFAHYLVALTGTWMWLRDRELSIPAAAVGTAIFTLGGYLVSVLNLTNHLQGGVWAPWVLFLWCHYVRVQSPRTALVLVIVLSVQLLGGSPESLLMTLAVVAAWTSYERLPRASETLKLAIIFGGVLLLVAGLCAVQILPTIEYLSQSSRAAALSREEVMHWSLQPPALLQLLFPHSSALLPASEAKSLGPGFERNLGLLQSPYLGIATLCLVIVGLARGRERAFWGATIFTAIVLGLGDQTPLLPFLYDRFPELFGRFRYPEKFFFLVHLAAAVLAAEGTERLVRRDSAAERIAIVALATLILVVAIPLHVLRWWYPTDYLRLLAVLSGKYLPPTAFVSLGLDTYWKVQRMALVLLALAAILLLRRSVLSDSTSRLLIVALVVVDLASTNRNLNLAISWPDLAQRTLLVEARSLRSSGQRIFHFQVTRRSGAENPRPEFALGRWFHTIDASQHLPSVYGALWESLYADAGMVYGVASVSGGDGIARASDTRLLAALGRLPIDRGVQLLRIFGAAYLIGPDRLDAPGLAPVEPDHPTPYYTYRVEGPLPLVYTVRKLSVSASADDEMDELSLPAFRPTEEALVDELPSGWAEQPGHSGDARVDVVAREDRFLRLRVVSTTSTFVVVNQSYFPGWEAHIDGSEAPIRRANAIVQGLTVGAGTHTIELRYQPGSYSRGLLVSSMSLVTFCLLVLLTVWRTSRRGEEENTAGS
jgi:hypothetical protein